MYHDGIYGEFAVFEVHELATIAYTPGRVVWRRDEALDVFASPRLEIAREATAYYYEEALTNLYVGLLRERRGEMLAGFELVQVAAVQNVLKALGGQGDPFNPTRRVETRHPEMISFLMGGVLGYGKSGVAAAVILRFIEKRYEVNPTMKREIERLLET